MRLTVVLTLMGIAGACIALAAPPDDTASPAGEKWLSLLDDQKYADSWSQAGSMFRQQVMQDQWVAALKRAREPLGALVSRTASRVEFVNTLRGAPDGDYCILHFKTTLHTGVITERLTLIKEDGQWMAAAYAIH